MSYSQQDLVPQARGDTWTLKFIIQDSAGTAIDISGNQYWLTLKSNISLTDSAAELQVGPIAAGSPDATNGIIILVIPSSLTNTLTPATYNYDLQEVDNTSKVTTLLIGKIKVKADVTRTADYSGTASTVVSSAGRSIYSGTTTSISATEIFIGGTTGSRTNVTANSVLAFDALVAGRDNTTGDTCAYQLNGALERDSTTTQIIGSVGKTILGEDVAGFDVNITADDTNDALKLEVTAASTNTTKWTGEVQYTEVSF
jgi:hypothetical protein